MGPSSFTRCFPIYPVHLHPQLARWCRPLSSSRPRERTSLQPPKSATDTRQIGRLSVYPVQVLLQRIEELRVSLGGAPTEADEDEEEERWRAESRRSRRVEEEVERRVKDATSSAAVRACGWGKQAARVLCRARNSKRTPAPLTTVKTSHRSNSASMRLPPSLRSYKETNMRIPLCDEQRCDRLLPLLPGQTIVPGGKIIMRLAGDVCFVNRYIYLIHRAERLHHHEPLAL
jgi:hypothetical protein